MRVDETRSSILKKKEALEKLLLKYPRFREGLLSLAISWIQLHRAGEALEVLTRFHQLDDQNAEVEYYLTILNSERLNFPQAWIHLRQAENLVKKRDYTSKTLKQLHKALLTQCKE